MNIRIGDESPEVGQRESPQLSLGFKCASAGRFAAILLTRDRISGYMCVYIWECALVKSRQSEGLPIEKKKIKEYPIGKNLKRRG